MFLIPLQPDQLSHRLTAVSHLAAAAAHMVLVGEDQPALRAMQKAFEMLDPLVSCACPHGHEHDDSNFNLQILRFVEQLEELGRKS